MRRSLGLRSPLLGAAIGAALSLTFALGSRSAGEAFGSSAALFVVSLPWSVLVTAVGAPIVGLLGLPEPVAARVVLWSMPVFAGAAWGGIVALVRAVRASSRQHRAAALRR